MLPIFFGEIPCSGETLYGLNCCYVVGIACNDGGRGIHAPSMPGVGGRLLSAGGH